MTQETLGNNQMYGAGSPRPLEEAIWIFEWLDLVIRLQKE